MRVRAWEEGLEKEYVMARLVLAIHVFKGV
jgi:hypothetical protein